MTLSPKLWLATLLPLVVCLLLSCTVLLTSRRVREARESEQFARSVMRQMLELNRLTYAYLQRHGDPGRMLLCTGFSATMDAEQAYALGINAFLMKPLELRELGSATHDVLA